MSDDRAPRDPEDGPTPERSPDEADAADADAERLANDPAAALGLPPVLDPSALGAEPMRPPPDAEQPAAAAPRKSSPVAVGCLGMLSLIPIGAATIEEPVFGIFMLVVALVVSLANKGLPRAFGTGMLVGLLLGAVVFGACLSALSNI